MEGIHAIVILYILKDGESREMTKLSEDSVCGDGQGGVLLVSNPELWIKRAEDGGC